MTTPPTEGATHPHSLLQAFQSLLYVIVIALFIMTFTAQPFRIPSESMEPTLLVGDFLLVNKQVGLDPAPHLYPPEGEIHRGDLVVFHFPVDPSLHLVKRVVGLPGDRLRLHEGRVYIDDRPIVEPYAVFQPAGLDPYRDEFPHLAVTDPGVESRWWIEMHTLVAQGELTIPDGNYFVLGDNRNDSEDSRYWGLVPAANIVGKPFLIYFSLNHPGPIPGQANAETLNPRPAASSTPTGFVRWERTLHILR